MSKAVVIGGANGIGLSVALQISMTYDQIIIIDRDTPTGILPSNIIFEKYNLLTDDLLFLDKHLDCDTLFYSAGFGRVDWFENIEEVELSNSFDVNTIIPLKIIHQIMPKLLGKTPFRCGVMVSIAARIASPLFAVYSATKAALFRGIEAINSELSFRGSDNRILEVSPGAIKGTRFNGGVNDLSQTHELAKMIIEAMFERKELLIPEYDTVFKEVISRYNADPLSFGLSSIEYKLSHNRLNHKPQRIIGYLSGTFDLFHIGHLNLLKRAKQHCDYLVVGVHKDASHKKKETFIPFKERVAIIESIKYVDKVIPSEKEDSDVYKKGIVKYDRLFVGSDYKDTERFNRYEEYFADKGVEIIYFPYTNGTSSTQLRTALSSM